MLDVQERGVITCAQIGDGWRLTWMYGSDLVHRVEGSRYDIFDALVDWGFPGEVAGEVVAELFPGRVT